MSDLMEAFAPTRRGLQEPEPPHSNGAEQATIGSILIDNTCMDTISTMLRPDDFYAPAHESIYGAMLALYEDGKPIDGVTIREALLQRGEWDRIGGDDPIFDAMAATPSAASFRMYAGIVRQKSIVRHLISSANAIIERGMAGTSTAEQVVEFASERMAAVIDRASTVSASDGSMAALMDEAIEALERKQKLGSSLCGLSTGFAELDRITLGLEAGTLTVLAARPSLGKSALASNICESVSVVQGKHAMFASLEMSRLQLAFRLLSAQSSIPHERLRVGGALDEADVRALSGATSRIGRSPMVILDSGIHTFTQIAASARQRSRAGRLDLLVVDYLQLMEGSKSKDNRTQEVGKFSRGLKLLARELDIPVIALSQLNRSPEGSGKDGPREPRLSDLRDSGSIEQDADNVWFLHRAPDDPLGITNVIVAKNRNGGCDRCKLSFQKAFVRFRDFVPAPANVADTAAY